MLKALYEKILSTAQPILTVVENAMFCVTSDGKATELRPTIDHPDILPLNSLDALVKMIKTEAPRFTEAPLYITIPSHLLVQCFTQPEPTERFFRQFFYEVKATDVPGWDSKVQLGFEEMQIALRTRFQETPDALYGRSWHGVQCRQNKSECRQQTGGSIRKGTGGRQLVLCA